MPKSTKKNVKGYPRIDFESSVDHPVPLKRGDSRMPPMDMEDKDYLSPNNWVDLHTRKLKFRHGEVGENLGVNHTGEDDD